VALVYNGGVKQKNNLFIVWQHIIGICILVLTVLFSWLFLAEKTSDRLQDQIAQARKIALSHSSIATIETDSFFHGKEAYLSFIGKDREGQELAVLVAQADDAVYTYPLKEGVSSKKAASVVKEKSQDAIDRVTFGRFKGKPIWEVKVGSSYYVVDFKTGKVTGVF
jgi:peptidase propeptide and YPEB domain protein